MILRKNLKRKVQTEDLHCCSPPFSIKEEHMIHSNLKQFPPNDDRVQPTYKVWTTIKKVVLFSFIAALSLTGYGQQELSQWRGVHRNGIYPDVNLMTSWPKGGPPLLLRIDGLGEGHSSPAIYNGKIYLTGKRDSLDVLYAFDMKGKLLWESPYGKGWYASYPDTRHTPTIENDRIYITSGMGEVVCMNAETGKIFWRRDPHTEFGGAFGTWGMAESILLTDKGVISSVGGTGAAVVALNKDNGELLWKTPPTGEKRTYVSPLLIDRNGQKIIITVLSDNILGIDADNGEIIWKFSLLKELVRPDGRRRRNYANTPIYKNGEIFYTSGYDEYSVMLSLSPDGRSVKMKWKNDVLDTHHGGVVEVNGYIYGSNWYSNNDGKWVCLEWETGKVMYEKDWHNKGQIIYADGHLYCKEERNGHVALVSATPSGFNVTSEFLLGRGRAPYWSHQVIHDGKLFIRHGEELMIYDIKKQ